jgi:hypothetical protein
MIGPVDKTASGCSGPGCCNQAWMFQSCDFWIRPDMSGCCCSPWAGLSLQECRVFPDHACISVKAFLSIAGHVAIAFVLVIRFMRRGNSCRECR